MNQRDDLDRMLSAWLDDPSTPSTARILGEVLERTRRTRQQPAWTSLERWLPMAVITRPNLSPPLRMAWLLLVGVLMLALATSVAIVGSRLLASIAPETGLAATFPIPIGGEAVFAYDSNGDIFTVRADGTDVRQLTSGSTIESSPVWSPDGTTIAYLDKGALAVMDAGGGSRKTLVPVCAGGGAAWSPSGSSLIATCNGRDLSIVAADGSSPATKLLAPGLTSSMGVWSPDGTQIAFVGAEATDDTGVYTVDVGATGGLAGGLQPHRITEVGTDVDWFDPRWSPDGTELAASAGTNPDCIRPASGSLDTFLMKADGSDQRSLAAETAKEYYPTWSPDGHRVAFQRLVEPAEWVAGRPCTTATWVIDADGTNERRLEGFGPDPIPPLWSPDGTRIAGAGPVGEPAELGLYFVTVDGSTPLVTVDVNNDFLSGTWQPVAAPLPPASSIAPASPTP